MLLAEVVDASAGVAATRSRTTKTAVLADLLRRADSAEVPVVTSWLSGEVRQGRIGVGWRTLAAARTDPAGGASLSVRAVDDVLTAIAGTAGAGSAGRREQLLSGLLAGATAAEQAFLAALVGGELRHGALEGVMLAAVAQASDVPTAQVRRAFMLSGSLPETASAALSGGGEALSSVSLTVGRPVRPMLASPGSSIDTALAAMGSDVTVEFKLDGARIQVHRDGETVRVWTRTLREITDGVPELVDRVRTLPCRTAILDGETLALDDDGRPRAFQDTMSRFGSDGSRTRTAPGSDADPAPGSASDPDPRSASEPDPGSDPGSLLSPFFFDVLHLDGVDLLDEPLHVRLDALAGLLSDDEHALLRMPGVRNPDPDQAATVLDDALTAGHEGVVVKDLRAPYAAGRRGKAWQKVKPVHTLDLVVLGAEWGYGRRTGSLSNIHLGARDPDGGDPVMIGKTFKGMTDELLAWQTETFPTLALEEPPWGVVLRPELVVEVAVDGAQRSVRYPGGVALRFARVVRYRPDRTAADADTLDTVRALLHGADDD